MYAVLQAKLTQVSQEDVPQAAVPVSKSLKTSPATPAAEPLARTVSNKTPDSTPKIKTAVALTTIATADASTVQSSLATPAVATPAVAPKVLSGTTAVPTAASDVAPIASSELPHTSKELQPTKQTMSGMAISVNAPATTTPKVSKEVQVKLTLDCMREKCA